MSLRRAIEKLKTYRWQIGVALILLVASSLRLFDLSRVPLPLADEVVSAVDFHYLTTTGRHFDGSHAGLLAYVTPVVDGRFLVSLFGTTVPDFRLVAAFFGVLTVGLMIWIGLELGDVSIGIFSAAALAIMPWHVYFSRIFFPGSEYLFLTILAICLELSALRSRNIFLAIGSAIAAAGSIYLYPVALVSTPLLMASVLVYRWPDVKDIGRRLVVAGVVAGSLLLLLPYAYEHYFVTDSVIATANSVTAQKLIWNHGLDMKSVAQLFVFNWTSYLKPQFIFMTGDPNVRQSTQHIGAVGWALGILGLMGIASFLIRPSRLGWFLLGLTAAYPVADALTYFDASANSLRGLTGSVVWALWAAVGTQALLRVSAKSSYRAVAAVATLVALLLQSSLFLSDYLGPYTTRYAYAFETGYTDIYGILQRRGLEKLPITLHAGYERYAMLEYFSQYRLHVSEALLSCSDLPPSVVNNIVLPRIFIIREDRDFAAYPSCVNQTSLLKRDESALAAPRQPGDPRPVLEVISVFPNDPQGGYNTAIVYLH